MRTADLKRDTRETQIQLALSLDGTGKASIVTGVGFLDHMLELFARHGDFDLTLSCQGDTHVDCHHSVEDAGICLGLAFTKALGDKRGIVRYGQCLLPMDETLVLCAADGPIWAGRWTCPVQKWGILTRNWPRNSGWLSCGTVQALSISGNWRGKTPTIF